MDCAIRRSRLACMRITSNMVAPMSDEVNCRSSNGGRRSGGWENGKAGASNLVVTYSPNAITGMFFVSRGAYCVSPPMERIPQQPIHNIYRAKVALCLPCQHGISRRRDSSRGEPALHQGVSVRLVPPGGAEPGHLKRPVSVRWHLGALVVDVGAGEPVAVLGFEVDSFHPRCRAWYRMHVPCVSEIVKFWVAANKSRVFSKCLRRPVSFSLFAVAGRSNPLISRSSPFYAINGRRRLGGQLFTEGILRVFRSPLHIEAS